MSSKGSGTVIVRMSDPKVFTPKLTVRVTAVKDKPNTYLLQIIHPNKTEGVIDPKTGQFIQDKRTGKFKKVGKILHSEEVVNKNPDQLKAFLEVKAKGDLLVRTEYANVSTAYEEILFIPAAKKGKMKMKTKEAAQKGLEEDYSDGKTSTDDEDVELMTDDDFSDTESLEDASDLEVNLPEDLAIKGSSSKKEPKLAAKAKKVKEKTKNKVKNNTKSKKVKKTSKTKVKNNKNKGKR